MQRWPCVVGAADGCIYVIVYVNGESGEQRRQREAIANRFPRRLTVMVVNG
jgi:hypothetical protein